MASSSKQFQLNPPSVAQITDCPICLETLKAPKGLPCFHTFCLECLQKYTADKINGQQMSCPVCIEPFTVPVDRLRALPNNFFIKESLEVFSIDNQFEIVEERETYCDSHKSNPMRLFCLDCQLFICFECRKLKHITHRCAELEQAAMEFTDQLKQCLPQLGLCTKQCEVEIQQLSKYKDDLLAMHETAEKSIGDSYKALLDVIETQRKQLLSKLTSYRDEGLKAVEMRQEEMQRQSVSVEGFKKHLEEFVGKSSAYQISCSVSDLLARAQQLIESQEELESKLKRLKKYIITFSPIDKQDMITKTNKLIGNVSLKEGLFLDFMSNIRVIHVLSNETGEVLGIAKLDSQYLIMRRYSRQIEIYNKIDCTVTDHVPFSDSIVYPNSLVACSRHNCLYISDTSGYIHRVKLSNKSFTKWTVNGGPCGLSISRAHCLLVTICNANKLQEYTTRGQLLREINLDGSIVHPWHSAKLSTGQFVVCHGGVQDTINRVCVVNTEGRIVRSYGGARGSAARQLNGPFCLAVDLSDNVLVVDCHNNEVHLFSSTLSYLGDVILPGCQLSRPFRLHVDNISGRLCIGQM